MGKPTRQNKSRAHALIAALCILALAAALPARADQPEPDRDRARSAARERDPDTPRQRAGQRPDRPPIPPFAARANTRTIRFNADGPDGRRRTAQPVVVRLGTRHSDWTLTAVAAQLDGPRGARIPPERIRIRAQAARGLNGGGVPASYTPMNRPVPVAVGNGRPLDLMRDVTTLHLEIEPGHDTPPGDYTGTIRLVFEPGSRSDRRRRSRRRNGDGESTLLGGTLSADTDSLDGPATALELETDAHIEPYFEIDLSPRQLNLGSAARPGTHDADQELKVSVLSNTPHYVVTAKLTTLAGPAGSIGPDRILVHSSARPNDGYRDLGGTTEIMRGLNAGPTGCKLRFKTNTDIEDRPGTYAGTLTVTIAPDH